MRYIIVHVPNQDNVRYVTITREEALSPTSRHIDKGILPVYYCLNAQHQENVMQELAGKYPGEVFSPAELTTGISGLPGPVQKLKIVDKGMIQV